MNYYLHIIILIEIYVILALSLNLQLGFTGLMNLAMGIFYGFGAYIYALTVPELGFFTALLVAILGNMILSLFISLSSVWFKEDIFILVSLAFQTIGYAVLWNWTEVTGGPYGISNISQPTFLGYKINTVPEFAVFGGFLMMCVIVLSDFIYHSPFGRTLQTIRDDEVAAETLGKNTVWLKIKSVAISCGMAAFAGVLYASYITYIDATSFGMNESIDVIFILILGGVANVRGAVIGAVIFIVLQELFKNFGLTSDIAFNLRNILFAIFLILVLFFRPKGLAGKLNL